MLSARQSMSFNCSRVDLTPSRCHAKANSKDRKFIGTPEVSLGLAAAWKARYEAKYPNQFQIYSPYSYDATMTLVNAMVKATDLGAALRQNGPRFL